MKKLFLNPKSIIINKEKNFFSNYFLIVILISSFVYFLWLLKLLNDFPTRYVFTDWIINYEGGYLRRGLIGQISIYLANFFKLNIKYIFFLIHLFIYLLFHFLFYKFFFNFKKNYIFYFFCFSPLVFLYPIVIFESLARKEIFYITFFLINCYLLIKICNRSVNFFLTNFFVILSYFIHEASILFIFFFYFSYFIFLKRNTFKIKLYEILIIFIIFLIFFYFILLPVTEEKIIKMVFFINTNFFEITRFSGAISWIDLGMSGTTGFLKYHTISFTQVFIHLIYLHFLIFFILLLFINNFFKFEKFFLPLTILTFFTPLILFFIATDWGRWTYILYNFCLIFTFYCLYSDKNVFLKISKLPIFEKTNLKLKLFLTICYISLWSPKLWFFEGAEFFPLFDLFFDLIKYTVKYSNFFFNLI
jgi:hypothetical protein